MRHLVKCDISYCDKVPPHHNDIQHNDIQHKGLLTIFRAMQNALFHWHHDIHHNDIQHYDTQQKGLICDTQQNTP
jgi:hypothetical protein